MCRLLECIFFNFLLVCEWQQTIFMPLLCIYSGVSYNEQCYNERILQRTDFINNIWMLQRTRRNIIGRHSTRVSKMCWKFLLWLHRHSLPLFSFILFNYQFSSVICLFTRLAVTTILQIFYINFTIIFLLFCIIYFRHSNGCVGWKLCCSLWVWNGLHLNTYISMYARMNRSCNEQFSRTSYVRSCIPHCI